MQTSTPLDCAPALPGPLPRRNSRAAEIRWGERVVHVGGHAPVCVQSMTNTDTSDAIGTAIQVKELARTGSELVRITVDTPAAAAAVPVCPWAQAARVTCTFKASSAPWRSLLLKALASGSARSST